MQFLLTGHLVTLNIYRLVSFAGFVTARERRLASALGGVFYCGPDTAAAASEWPPASGRREMSKAVVVLLSLGTICGAFAFSLSSVSRFSYSNNLFFCPKRGFVLFGLLVCSNVGTFCSIDLTIQQLKCSWFPSVCGIISSQTT